MTTEEDSITSTGPENMDVLDDNTCRASETDSCLTNDADAEDEKSPSAAPEHIPLASGPASTEDAYQEVIDDLRRRGLHAFAEDLIKMQNDEKDGQCDLMKAVDKECQDRKLAATTSTDHAAYAYIPNPPGTMLEAENDNPEHQKTERQRSIISLLDMNMNNSEDNDQGDQGDQGDQDVHVRGDIETCNMRKSSSTKGEETVTYDSSGSFADGVPVSSAASAAHDSSPLQPQRTPSASASVSQPHRAQRTASSPGAYNVVSSLEFHESQQQQRAREQEEADNSASTEAEDSGAHPDRHELSTLEAVRVDDIPTVSAEPVHDHDTKQEPEHASRNIMLAACVICAVVIVGLAVGLSSRSSTTDSTPDGSQAPVLTATPTLAPINRFVELRDFYIEIFAPFYGHDKDDEPRDGAAYLEELYLDTNSTQYKALEWIALEDTEVKTSISLEFLRTSTPANVLDAHNRGRLIQRYVLALLYFATGGPTNWDGRHEFLTPGHECEWSAPVFCSEEQHGEDIHTLGYVIDTIDLRESGLTGPLIPELGALTHLNTIVLSGNELIGNIPSSLASLTELRVFDVAQNKLNGTLPESLFTGWLALESLKLGDNNDISGTLPSEIGNLTHLKALGAERLSWQGTVPKELYQRLTNLEFLEMSNMVHGFVNDTIPTEIGLWTNVQSFIFHGAELKGTIPTEIGLATKLQRLQLSSNHLSGVIPTELGLLTAMTRLHLSVNALTGTVPSSFTQFQAVSRLELENTLLTGDIGFLCDAAAVGNMSVIENLRVDMMEVSGCYCCACCEY